MAAFPHRIISAAAKRENDSQHAVSMLRYLLHFLIGALRQIKITKWAEERARKPGETEQDHPGSARPLQPVAAVVSSVPKRMSKMPWLA